MDITLVGYLCLLSSPILFIKPTYLCNLVLFFSIFSATAAINLELMQFGLQPYHFFAILLIFNRIIFKPNFFIKFVCNYTFQAAAFFLFIFFEIISTINSGSSFISIAQLMHLTLGFMTMICIASCINSEEKLKDALRYFLLGGVFAALWGVLHFILHIIDFEYPAILFNNSVGAAALGYVSTLLNGGIPRVSSVATEPSYLVRSTIPMLAILYIFWNFKLRLASRSTTYFYIILLALVTVLSTSTLGFFGLFILYLIFLYTARPSFIAKVLSLFVLAFAFVLMFFFSELLYSVLNELVFEKFTVGSGEDRLNTLLIGVENFFENPFLGVGPGLLTVHDLFIKMYSNFGLFGATFYFVFIFSMIFSTYKIIIKIKLKFQKLYITYLSIVIANIILFTLDVVSGMSYTYGIFWVLLGLLMSLKNLDEYKKIEIV